MKRLLDITSFLIICKKSQMILNEHFQLSSSSSLLLEKPTTSPPLQQLLISHPIKIEDVAITTNKLDEQCDQLDDDFKIKILDNTEQQQVTTFEFINIDNNNVKIEMDSVKQQLCDNDDDDNETRTINNIKTHTVSDDKTNDKHNDNVIHSNMENDIDTITDKIINEIENQNYIGSCKYCGMNFKKILKIERHEKHQRCIKKKVNLENFVFVFCVFNK